MEEYSRINPVSIKNILTLRYDPTISPLISKLTWQDCVASDSNNETTQVENLIVNNIKKEIGSSVKKITISLSGGIDSTLILALLRKIFPDMTIDAISVRFADSIDESNQAKRITEQFEANHKIVFLENYLEELPHAISIIKLPFWDLHWYHVVKEAKSSSNFLVSGDGGDELFGGYTFRYQKFLSLIDENSSSRDKVKAYLDCHERDWVPDQEKLFGKKIPFLWNDIFNLLEPYFNNPLSPIEQVFLADFNGKLLYNWMPLNTAFHKYFDVKAITPILSPELISYATHLNPVLKYDKKNNTGKILLRKILFNYIREDFLVPTKQGFSVNTINLWKSHGKRLCEQYILKGHAIKEGLINKEWVDSHFNKVDSTKDTRYINKFLGLLALEIWYRMFVTKEMRKDQVLN